MLLGGYGDVTDGLTCNTGGYECLLVVMGGNGSPIMGGMG